MEGVSGGSAVRPAVDAANEPLLAEPPLQSLAAADQDLGAHMVNIVLPPAGPLRVTIKCMTPNCAYQTVEATSRGVLDAMQVHAQLAHNVGPSATPNPDRPLQNVRRHRSPHKPPSTTQPPQAN